MSTLGGYLRDELQRRDWSPEEFARRCVPPTSTTLIYKIMAGEDNVKMSTFEAMATGLGMTPVELLGVVRGGHQLAPDEIAALTAYRRVAHHKRPTALDMLHWLGVQAARSRDAKGPRRLDAKGAKVPRNGLSTQGPHQPDDTLNARWCTVQNALASPAGL